MASEPTTSMKTRAGEFFRKNLDMNEIHFFLNNANTDSAPPYGVVTVTAMEETTPGSHVYHVEIKIAVVTSIDISSSDEHDILLEKVMDKLAQIPKRTTDPDVGIRIFGWVNLASEAITKEESQSFSDVITIRLGCGG